MFKSINWSSNIFTATSWLSISTITSYFCPSPYLIVKIESFKPIRSTIPLAITSSFGIWYNCHFKLELPALIAIVLDIIFSSSLLFYFKFEAFQASNCLKNSVTLLISFKEASFANKTSFTCSASAPLF